MKAVEIGFPQIPKNKRTEKTDHAKDTSQTAKDFLAELDALLGQDQ